MTVEKVRALQGPGEYVDEIVPQEREVLNESLEPPGEECTCGEQTKGENLLGKCAPVGMEGCDVLVTQADSHLMDVDFISNLLNIPPS